METVYPRTGMILFLFIYGKLWFAQVTRCG
jgi:hypothetical protein